MKLQFSLALLSAITAYVQAVPIAHDEIVSKATQGLRLLSLEEGADPVWKTEDEKLELMRGGINFFDVTEEYETIQSLGTQSKAKVDYPPPSHQWLVRPILATVSIFNMQSYLSRLTSYNNRFYNSTTGEAASNWIRETVARIASRRSDITVSEFNHSWPQSSVIARFEGSNASYPVTILGSHLDSVNLSSPSSGRAPGADDDGTGTVNLIEAFRALVAARYHPSTPLEFHWYAAEEVGLLGSQAVANTYASNGVDVKAFMELDMSGYFEPGTREVMAIQADYVDDGLNTFLGQLIDEYSRIPWVMDIPCGYACSDHASWNRVGYPSTFPFEAVTGDDNPQIHTSNDTTSVSGFSWSHSLEFAKIGVAFAVELTA